MANIKLPTAIVIGLALILLGIIGSIVPGMFAALFFGSTAGWRVMLIIGVLLAAWFPLKMVMDRLLGSSSGMLAGLPGSTRLATIGVVLAASIVLVPFLWMVTSHAIALALLMYAVSRVWWAGLIGGLLMLAFSVYQTAKRDAESVSAPTFRVTQFGNAGSFFTYFEEGVAQKPQTSPRLLSHDYETVIEFPEPEPAEDDWRSTSSAPDTITIDPVEPDSKPE